MRLSNDHPLVVQYFNFMSGVCRDFFPSCTPRIARHDDMDSYAPDQSAADQQLVELVIMDPKCGPFRGSFYSKTTVE